MTLIPRGNFFDSDRFLNEFFSPTQREGESTSNFFAPRVDIKELEDHYEITAELPGISKDNIHITLDNGVLTLEAETQSENKEEQAGKVIRQERRYGKFMRSFNLGEDVHQEDISASFTDGVLALKAPKHKEQTPPQRRTEIS
jgi:HSP20 family protein